MTILDDALAAVPGYTEAKTAVDTVKHWRAPPLVTAGGERRRIAAELVEAAKAGRPLPDGLAERIDTDQRNGALQIEVVSLITDTLAQVQDALRRTVVDGIDHGYRHVQQHLDELCRQVRTKRGDLTPLVGLDADSAIRSGQVKLWQHVEHLIDQYAGIRHAHFALAAMENPAVQRHVFAVSGQVQDPCDVDPYWLGRRMYSSGHTRSDVSDGDYLRHIEWLNAARGRPIEGHQRADVFPSTLPRLAWLLTIADHTHTPWVPGPDALTDAYETATVVTRSDFDAAKTRARIAAGRNEPVRA